MALASLPLAAPAAAASAAWRPQETAPNDGDQGEVEAKYRRALAEFGDRLTEAQKVRLRRTIQEHVRMLGAVRSFSLANPDPPATVLKLITGPER
ncbi:MAG: hypothetical protein ACRD2H_14300 [Terriglobales bacterium]